MIRILITGRHLGVTEAMKEYAREKVGKLAKIFDRLTKVEVTMDVTHHDTHEVEIVVDASGGARLVGKAESPDMYAAVDLAEDKLVRQLVKHKQRLTDHHRGGASMGTVPHAGGSVAGSGPESSRGPSQGASGAPGRSGGAEDTYEDVIERLGEE